MKLICKNNLLPLCNIDNYRLLCYKNGALYNLDTRTQEVKYISNICSSAFKRFLSRSPFVRRYFGLYNIKGVRTKNNQFLILYNKQFYLLDIISCRIKVLDNSYNHSVLHLASSSKGVIWGEYGYNPFKKAKSVFCFNEEREEIDCLYTFKEGEINHIHNVVEDSTNGRIYILTGDFNEAAGIYYTDDFFKNVFPLMTGSQKYRTCYALPYNDSIIYATDSPSQTNFLYELKGGKLRCVSEINGSCIYACRYGDFYIGSTTVENEPDEYNNKKNKFRYNLGRGIKDWYVELFSYNLKTGTYRVLIREKKDFLPMLAFNYGLFIIPKLNQDYLGKLCVYGQSLKNVDQKLVAIDFKDFEDGAGE